MDANGFFSATIESREIRQCSIYPRRSICAQSMYESENKTKYCIDDIIGEVIRDPAHSEAIANPQPPRYIISSEAGLKGMLMKIKENAANYRDKMGRKMRRCSRFSSGVASFPREIAEKTPTFMRGGNR